MEEAIITVKNLKKAFRTYRREAGLLESIKSLFVRNFKEVRALKGVDFEIQKGEIVGFIGPNGAGKSTAIKVMSGLLYPDFGKVKCLGFNPWTARERYLQNVGVVFGQKTQLSWDIPPLDTYHFLKDVYEIPDVKFRSRLNYMVKILGIGEIIKTPTRNLSLGERMRCELVAALLHNPDLVFLDEPTVGVDIIAKEVIREFIVKLNQEQGTTFIITTHDMGDIEKLCKHIIIINHGEIVFDSTLQNLKQNYVKTKFIDVKLAEPQKFILGKYEGKVISKTKIDLKIEVRAKYVNNLIYWIMKNCKVADITVTNPPIEKIITQIYRK
ncbi:MAG: ATP-binding cassette domain-containing protein [DPANN group archaeon]|nr:ATP-binding cassette domain-containing protein [DPANN group archaeon]